MKEFFQVVRIFLRIHETKWYCFSYRYLAKHHFTVERIQLNLLLHKFPYKYKFNVAIAISPSEEE